MDNQSSTSEDLQQQMQVRCPNCNMSWFLHPPARIDRVKPGTHPMRFEPSDHVRCVNCKSEFFRPLHRQE